MIKLRITKSKRLLAVLLSVVMVFTAIACVPFISYGATINQLESLMTQYENRVNQTKKVYTNLAASYNAYYDAYTTLVGYEAGLSGYGETSITNAYNALKTQYDAMTVFTGYKGTGTASFGSAATQPSGYTNLLYANGSADTGYNFSFKVSSIPTVGFEWAYWAYFYYPTTVLLYDGTTTSMPVLMGLQDTDKNYDLTAWSGYTNSDKFELRNNWYGYSDGFLWADSTSLEDGLNDPVTLGYSSTTRGTDMSVGNTTTMRNFSNILYYTGNPASTVTSYDSLTWFSQSKDATASGDFSQTIKVINYKQLLDAVSGKKIDVSKSTYASALAYCQAMDTATSLDPNSYFTSGDGTNNCATAIESAISNLTTAYSSVSATTDFTSYRTYARTYAAYDAVDNTSGYYTADSFASFTTAVNNAKTVLQGISTKSTRMTDASSDLATLQAAFNALEKTAEYVDDTDMEMYINAFNTLSSSSYTAETYNALQNAINNAISACYNDGNFASGIKLLADDPDDVALYNSHLNAITAAFQNLEATATEDDFYEQTGIVTVGGPIYLHGKYTANGKEPSGSSTTDYDYMMNGGTTKYVSDGTVPTQTTNSLTGEFKTEITYPVGYNLMGITAFDDAGTELTGSSLSVVDGVLTGSFDFQNSDLATLTQMDGTGSLNSYVTLRFVFDDDNDGVADVFESHRVAVKQNPVATHGVVYSEGYYSSWGTTRVRIVNFEAVALGSYGLLGDSRNASFDNEEGKDGGEGYYNWWLMYKPNSSEKECYDQAKIDGLTEDQPTGMDKVAGYYGASNKGSINSCHTVTLNTSTAYYYLDLSAPKDSLPEGIGYNTSTQKYYFRVFIGNLYNSKVTDAATISCNSHGITSGGSVFSESMDSTLTASGAFNANAATTGYSTISFTGSEGTLTGTYQVSYYQTASNNPTGGCAIINMPFAVKVVDKSAVRTVYDQYIAMALDSRCYSDESWMTYSLALDAAENYLNNYQSNANETTLISALNNAYNGLTLSTDKTHHDFTKVVTAPTCTTDGITTYTCSRCGYSYTAYPLSALGHDWVYTSNDDGSTHTKACSRAAQCGTAAVSENCVDDNSDGNCDLCGQTLKDPANFTEFNAVKAQMDAALAKAMDGTDKHSAEALQDLNTALAAVTYFNYTDAQQGKVTEDYQDAIDAQVTALQAALDAFNADTEGSGVYESFAKNVSSLNTDAMNVTAVNSALSGKVSTTSVAVNGDNYPAYNFDAYLTEYRTVMNDDTFTYYIPYTVTVLDYDENELFVVDNGDGTYSYSADAADASSFRYGDEITIKNPNVDETSDYACSWAVSATPQSSANGTESKFMAYTNEFTFTVRGDMYITTSGSRTGDNYRMIFKQSLSGTRTDKVLDVQYVEAGTSFTLKNATLPSAVAFYSMDKRPFSVSYDDGATVTAITTTKYTPTGDCVIYVNYTATDVTNYLVRLLDENGTELDRSSASFNKAVTFTAPGAQAFVIYNNSEDDDDTNDTTSVLCYGSTYSFFAYQDMDIYAVTSIDEVASVSVVNAPIIDTDNDKVYLVGTFALPAGCEIQAYGFVLDGANSNHAGLTLADVNKAAFVVNLTSSSHTNATQNGNQFSVKFNTLDGYTGSYVAYAIYTDANGDVQYAYSDVVTNAVFA